MCDQNETINKRIEIIKQNIKTLLDPRSVTTKMKNSLEGFNSRCQQTEERIHEHKHRTIEIIQSAEKKVIKCMKKSTKKSKKKKKYEEK